jgi:hypothetical protein
MTWFTEIYNMVMPLVGKVEYYLFYLALVPICEYGPPYVVGGESDAFYVKTYENCQKYAELEFEKKYKATKGNGKC